jgi:tRNA(Arg) A34 adenosine deaminase TadA
MQVQPDLKYMQRAIQLAVENVRTRAGGPFAALIVREGVVIAEAANSVTSTNDPTAHGEINAIRKACRELEIFSLQGCEIYTSSEPCPMCLAAIHWARIDRIYYGNGSEAAARAGFDDEFLYQQFKLGRDARAIPSIQCLPVEAWQTFQTWLDSIDRVNY